MESRGVVVVVDEYSDHQQEQQQHLSTALPININIPPGFRFVPSDIELIECYLKKRMISASSSASLPEADGLIVDFDIYSCNPWELPHHLFRYPSQQREMYFFSPTHPLHSSSSSSKRCDRTTGCGVWHCNGQDNRIVKNGVVIGHTTAFKFEMIDQPVAGEGAEKVIKGSNKRSNGNGNGNGNGRRKTDWLMHEYRLPSANALVLCKIYENKTRAAAAAAASSSSRKQQEHQQHHLLNTKRRRTVEEEEPLSVRPLAAMPMPSLVSMAYSNAPALDRMIQMPKLMQQQQLLLNTKRSRTVEEEEPLSVCPLAAMPMPSLASMAYSNAPALDRMIQMSKLMQQQQLPLNTKRSRTVEEEEPVPVCPLAAVLPPSSDITLMASAPVFVPVPAAQQQQQQQQIKDADSDFALALEQLLEEAAAERDMSCENAAAVPVPVPAVMPDEATFLSSWQNMPEFPSLQQKLCGSAPLTPTSTLTADKEFSADVAAAAAAVVFEQEATESAERPTPLLKRSQVDVTAIDQLPQQQRQQQEQGRMNTLDSTEAVSGTTEDEDMESLLKNISFDAELGNLPPLDFLTPGDELSMAPDKFFDGVEDYPF